MRVDVLATADDADAVTALDANVPMSLAHACLVRILERTEDGSIMTLDSDFHAYRRGRRTIRVLFPET